MKAYIKEEHEHEKKGRFDGHKIRLTIAMPVSNQVKTIRRCLDSLVPLLKAVPSELIITDTGSTDGTIEICREYTDHIEHFPWCDDMSAARNVGLKAAQGEWFLSIDDDEWLENVDEIIEFFNSGECDNYSSASYIQRNYTKLDGSFYMDHHTPRIARLIGNVHFEGRIHDTMVDRYGPTKMLKSYVHHYGFAFENKEARLAKFSRNVAGLKKDIEEFPHDLRYVYQMVKEYGSIEDYKTAIEWCLKGLAVEKEYPERERRLEITILLVKTYYANNQFQLAVDTANKFLTENPDVEMNHLDAYWFQIFSYIKMKQYEEAIQAGLTYLDTYQLYKAGKLNQEMLLSGGIDSMMPRAYNEGLFYTAKNYLLLQEYENAILYFDQIDFSECDVVTHGMIAVGLTLADKISRYERIADLYERIQQTKDEKKQENFILVTEDYFKQNKNTRDSFIAELAKVERDDPYIILNKLRVADAESDKEKTQSLIDWFVNYFTEWNSVYADVLYFTMKYDLDITPFIDLFDVDDLRLYTAEIISAHLEFASITVYYFLKHSYGNSLKGLYWSICLREHVVLFSEGMNFEQYVAYFQSYAKDVAAYAHAIYKPEMFTEENVSILPRAYRFGHYMQLAFAAKDHGDEAEYLKNLKLALHHYPVMKEPIKVLSEYLEELHKAQERQENKRNEEFAKLANQVKSQIEQFLVQGQYQEAEAVLNELAEMLPNDEDVKRYRIQIQAAQAPKEIGAKIPQ